MSYHYRLTPTEGRDVVFSGRRLAQTNSKLLKGDDPARWGGTDDETQWLSLYRTEAGRYVAEREVRWWDINSGRTYYGEPDKVTIEVKVCSEVADVFEFFGDGWLAKELYNEAELDFAEVVK